MKNHKFAALVIAIVGLLIATLPSAGSVHEASAVSINDKRPNVVYILVDDMSADDLKYMPTTRRLIRNSGKRYTNAISQHPLCCPARAGILTGQYAQNNHVQHNKGPHGGYKVFDPSSTLATWLTEDGYQTALHGKYLNLYNQRLPDDPAARRPEPGWTVWDPLVRGVYDFKQFEFFNGDRYGTPADGDYVTTRMTERSVHTIEKFSADGAPFFIAVNHIAPHNAFGRSWKRSGNPPAYEHKYAQMFRNEKPWSRKKPSYNQRDISGLPRSYRSHKVPDGRVDKVFRARLRSLLSVDDSVEAIHQALRRTGELDNTYMVFVSDNGYSLGEHRIMKKDKLLREHLEVPLLVAGPGIKAGDRSTQIVTLLDLTATLLDLTGTRAGLQMDGASFRNELLGKWSGRWRTTTLVQTGSAKFRDGWFFRGVQTQRYLYGMAWNRSGPGSHFLYDRRRDAFEMVNVANKPRYRRVMKALRHRTKRLAKCAGSNCNQYTKRNLPHPRALD